MRPKSNAWLPRFLRHVSEHVREIPAPLLLWTLFSSASTICLLNTLRSRTHRHHQPHQNTDKQRADGTRSGRAEEDEKKREGENEDGTKEDSDVECIPNEEEENEQEAEGEQEEEEDSEEEQEDNLRKRK